MKALGIMGSPRKGGNTSILLSETMEVLGKELEIEIINVVDYKIKPCVSCRECLHGGKCIIKDEMFYDKLLEAQVIVIASPVYFGDITGQLKIALDRTWCLRGKLTGKAGGSIVVGRRYIDGALAMLNTFFLRHGMILNSRGVVGYAEERGEIRDDHTAINDAHRLGESILWLLANMKQIS